MRRQGAQFGDGFVFEPSIVIIRIIKIIIIIWLLVLQQTPDKLLKLSIVCPRKRAGGRFFSGGVHTAIIHAM